VRQLGDHQAVFGTRDNCAQSSGLAPRSTAIAHMKSKGLGSELPMERRSSVADKTARHAKKCLFNFDHDRKISAVDNAGLSSATNARTRWPP